jgi:tellurite resistance protein
MSSPSSGASLSPTGAATVPHERSLAHLPLPLFAAPMGIGGLGLAWREAARAYGLPALIGEGLLALAGVVWIVVFGLHLLRLLRHPSAFAGELKNPIRSAFAGAMTIGLMIVSGGLLPHAPGLAAVVWGVAVVVHLLIGVWIVRGLMLAPREAVTLTPALLIPLVGNILAPVFGAKLGFVNLSWALFGVGALLWAMVQPLVLGRLIHGPALMERMRPMLVILLAPPSIGSLALAALTGGWTPGALAFYGLAGFMAITLLTFAPVFMGMRFAMSWWGWTFPSASFAVATLSLAHATPTCMALTVAAFAALGIATIILTVVSVATLKAAAQGHLLLPE